MLLLMEDIGRHNAVDKVIGQAIISDIEMHNCILCLSGRIGSELVLKAAAAKIAVIIAVGAASSMAIDLARDAGIALYGFTRDESSVSYNRPIAQG
jgi:FdhD protein